MTRLINNSWLWFLMSILLFFGQQFGLSVVFSLGLFYFVFQFLDLQLLTEPISKSTTQQKTSSFWHQYAIFLLPAVAFLLLNLSFSKFMARLWFIAFIIYQTLELIITLVQLVYLRPIKLLKQTQYQWLYQLVIHLVILSILFYYPEYFNQLVSLGTFLIGLSLTSYIPIHLRKWPLPLWMTVLSIFKAKPQKKPSSTQMVPSLHSLSIYVHLENVKNGQFGHVDIGLGGKVYAYNNFDPDSWRLGRLVGDGVLVLAKEEDYLNFRQRHHSTTWVYNIPLTSEELNNVEAFLEETLAQTEPFELTSQRQLNHAVGKLTRWSPIHIYKFSNQFKYHTYYLLGMNCAQFTYDLITAAKLDVFTTFGLQTPGGFYHYLELQKKQHPHSFNYWKVLHPNSTTFNS